MYKIQASCTYTISYKAKLASEFYKYLDVYYDLFNISWYKKHDAF